MRTSTYLIAVLLGTSGCAAPSPDETPAGHQAGEEAAVLEAMDRFIDAISANDLETMARLQTADGMTYQAVRGEGSAVEIVARPNAFWIDPTRSTEQEYRERYWSPTVMVRGGIAVVWAPYEFRIDGEVSHCGVDVFDFVKLEGTWTVSNSMWTVEPGGCEELRPESGADMRPVG